VSEEKGASAPFLFLGILLFGGLKLLFKQFLNFPAGKRHIQAATVEGIDVY